MQRIRILTNVTGACTWVFPITYPVGLKPVISVTVEDATGATWHPQITSLDNASISIQLVKTTTVSVLGVNVLSVTTNPQAYVHVTANIP
jgi:hypothetical protein